MFGDGALAFREFVMREELPLATVHTAVLEFLQGRDDAVLFGAQAVNAYVDEPRMTQDVDIMSTRAEDLAEELRQHLNQRFHIAVRVRGVREGLGYRIYQVKKPKNRHLVDVRPVASFPPCERVEDVLVVTPAELVAEKTLGLVGRSKTAKALIDRADIHRVLLVYPDLKSERGAVTDRLTALGGSPAAFAAWKEIVGEEILPDDEDSGY